MKFETMDNITIPKHISVIHNCTLEYQFYRILGGILDTIVHRINLMNELDYLIVLNYGYEISFEFRDQYPKVIFM